MRLISWLTLAGLVFLAASLSRADEATAPEPASAVPAKVSLCAACHGKMGVSLQSSVPNLAAEPGLFMQWQLVYFRGETRVNPAMTAVSKTLTDNDIRELSDYYIKLAPPAPSGVDSDPELTKSGAAIAEDRHCSQCHLPNFAGQGEIPRLAGQHEDVIINALHDYQHGARRGRGNVIMPEIAYSLNEDDIKALAHFMSRQPG